MREILFRAKRLYNREWTTGNLFVSDTDGRTYILAGSRIVTIDWEVDPSTVCQYTGMKDKNGKRIFEGDIIKKTNKGRHPEIFIANIRTCFYTNEEVYYSPCDHFTESCEYEIIGNIHDNKLEDFDNGR